MPHRSTLRLTRVIEAPKKKDKRRLFSCALRETFKSGYRARDLRSDVLAGLVVGIVALPLAMALAIASGVAPQHGLYTAIIAGAAIALFGGSKVNVSGPTAAFVVLLAPVTAAYGIGGLACASLLAGVVLVTMGISGLGRLIQYVPHPVTTGFTAGIAVVIATLQVKDALGLDMEAGSTMHWHERVGELASSLDTIDWFEAAIAAFTLAILILWPKYVTKRIPAPLIAISAAALLAWLLPQFIAGADIQTIASRFSFDLPGGGIGHGIPTRLPSFDWPWNLPGADGSALGLDFSMLSALLMPALSIAMLGAIESLLSAVVADGMAGTHHDPDGELIGQGIGNIVAPFFGGFAATGAIARTATNVRSGARSPIASVVHALFVAAALIGLGPLLGYLPMSALAALLLIVAWNMSDARHFVHTLRVAPGSDVLVLLTCFGLTVFFDMVIAVGVGIVLAAMLFMRRMADLSRTELLEPQGAQGGEAMPSGVLFYRIAGPMFFGAAAKAMDALQITSADARVVVLDLSAVPVMDLTGMVAFESALKRLEQHSDVVLVGVQAQPRSLMDKAELLNNHGNRLKLAPALADAIASIKAAKAAQAESERKNTQEST